LLHLPVLVVFSEILKVGGNTLTEITVNILAGTEVVVPAHTAKIVRQTIFRDTLLSAEEVLKILE
jgi:hypothetical protein